MHWIDPDSLPEIRGRFERFLLNPRGEADGLLLADGRETHFPPHMGVDLVPALEKASGADLRIRGVRPRRGDVFAAVSIELEGGARFEDHGPPDKPEKKPPPPRETRAISGRVRRALHGPKGELRGALLESGEIVRFPPHAAEEMGLVLTPGASFAAKGKGLKTRLGEVIEAEAFGPDAEALTSFDAPKKPKPPKADRRHPKP